MSAVVLFKVTHVSSFVLLVWPPEISLFLVCSCCSSAAFSPSFHSHLAIGITPHNDVAEDKEKDLVWMCSLNSLRIGLFQANGCKLAIKRQSSSCLQTHKGSKWGIHLPLALKAESWIHKELPPSTFNRLAALFRNTSDVEEAP